MVKIGNVVETGHALSLPTKRGRLSRGRGKKINAIFSQKKLLLRSKKRIVISKFILL